MDLPSNHSCDGCDPEDEDHRKLRLRKQLRNKTRARAKADQSWAVVRDSLSDILNVQKKFKSRAPITPKDIETIKMVLHIVLGEIYLRQADSIEN